ncbi:MAG TPA: DUF6457 domain-containing protein [Candidatus Limnocylindria bacterium]|nr:DUF6457 domain-containing protein [Candidatus Limnocylindria bacterium]
MDQPVDQMSVDAWLTRFASELPSGTGSELDADLRAALLDVARVAAHRSERIAAPLTTYLLGLALTDVPASERSARIRSITRRLER